MKPLVNFKTYGAGDAKRVYLSCLDEFGLSRRDLLSQLHMKAGDEITFQDLVELRLFLKRKGLISKKSEISRVVASSNNKANKFYREFKG